MSFSGYATNVRNPDLPHRHRASALRSCVQHYHPLGFAATISYLEELAGPYQHDEQALLNALDHLTTSRHLWHNHLRAYATDRRTAKQHGHRRPHPGETNPNQGPTIWYGAPRPAALHALTFWTRHRLPAITGWNDPGAHHITTITAACLATGGQLSPDHHAHLDTAATQVRDRLTAGLYDEDAAAYVRARGLLRVADLIKTAANGAARQHHPVGR
ncbi:hypothetical protein [Actinoplanes sp. NPDC051494]|uniref:hypothetical protein n=1 Tax=Actinoplanes sp. NPDC051494 TaxID=3363907 RepID=UPI0037A4E9CF